MTLTGGPYKTLGNYGINFVVIYVIFCIFSFIDYIIRLTKKDRLSIMLKSINSISDLYQHLDSLFEQDVDSDTLFASGYLRGFISLAAANGGDEQQLITASFIDNISKQLTQAKTELSPQDNAIVQNFWLALQQAMLS